MAIETKHPTRYAGLVERRLVALLDEFGWAGAGGSPVRVMSFSQLSLRRLRYLAPDLRSVMLFERVPLRFRDGSLPRGGAPSPARASRSCGRIPGTSSARTAMAIRCTSGPSTRPRTSPCAVTLGVEAIITNRPGRVLRALGRAAGARARPTRLSPDSCCFVRLRRARARRGCTSGKLLAGATRRW